MSDKVYTVSQVNSYIRYLFESDKYLSYIRIIGEVSNLYMPRTKGKHIYFTLKDDTSQIKCIIFYNIFNFLEFLPQNGMKIIVEGKMSVYEKRGEYSLHVSQVYPQGVGEFNKAFEALKRKLEKEGLFLHDRKRKLPFVPKRIGIITSIDGAAIKDIIKNALKRFPQLSFVIFPVHVQGAKAALEIVRAFDIIKTNEFNLDFVVITRGGGSIEELWPFNEEIVARAIYSSPIPVVSAVGHERDTTISDLVSDVRVSTPSMVAESAIPNKAELIERVILYVKSMKSITKNRIYLKKEAIRRLLMLPLFRFPQKEIVENRRDLVMKKIEGIINSESRIYKKKRQELDSMLKRLSGLNPLSILNRGYTITYKYPENTPIRRKKDIGNETKRIKTVFYDGEIISQIDLEGVNYE